MEGRGAVRRREGLGHRQRGRRQDHLAAALASALDAPAYSLDSVGWQPGWRKAPPDAVRAHVAAVTAGERWVVDGVHPEGMRAATRHTRPLILAAVSERQVLVHVTSRAQRRRLCRSLAGDPRYRAGYPCDDA